MDYATDEELLHIMEQEQRGLPDDQDDQDGGYDDGVAHSGHYTH